MGNTLKLTGKMEHEVTKDMVGLFFEDINFAADGGLYAEQLENRSFEAVKSMGQPRDYVLQGDYLYGWSLTGKDALTVSSRYELESDSARLEINEDAPLSEKNPHYVRFTAKKPGAGFANKAYDGILVSSDKKFNVSLFAKEAHYLDGNILVRIVKGDVVLAESEIDFQPAQKVMPNDYDIMVGKCEAKKWTKYETVLTVDEAAVKKLVACEMAADQPVEGMSVKGCEFQIILTQEGSVEFDLISLIPQDAVEGIFRKDLFQALADLHPGFLRFPGGCIVEGTSIMRRYRWKDTVGELKDRKINTNLWALQGGNTLHDWVMPDCHYMQSYGIGFYEYFKLCELLSTKERKCQPLPVLSIGVACQFRSYEVVDIDTEEFDAYVQDALDLIEFANGDVTTKYGALRAAMGHPESFGLELLAIGNEQWTSQHVDLKERYRRFEKAIHQVWPEIKCLGTAGPFIDHELHTDAWQYYREECKTNKDFTYAVDEHYYVAPQWLYDHVDYYDNYSRDIFVFAGEYAAHDVNQSNSVEAALAEAAMMTGMERNGDVVKLASYAPLFNRIGHSHWTPDMIWFDEEKVVRTPSYYVQKMFSDYAGESALALEGQEKELKKNDLYVSAVTNTKVAEASCAEDMILKIVNSSLEDKVIQLVDEKDAAIAKKATLVTLTSEGQYEEPVMTKAIDLNGPCKAVKATELSNAELCQLRKPQACKYEIVETELAGEITIPAKSFVALVIGK